MEKHLKTLTNLNDVYPITAKMRKKEKGNLFETFTYYLFKHEPRLNNGLEKIWMFNDIPKNILLELYLPSTDKGIDLLAMINGKYYAIQCKFRQDPNKIISWSSLSTFFGLSFGMNNKIAGGFFVTNTRNLCQEVINSKKVIAIYDDFYDSLSGNFFKNMTKDRIICKRKHKNTPQIESLTAACVHFLENRRGYMEMACGTGKTLASYWITCAISLGRTVIFVPSLQLLSQFYSDWTNQSYAEEKNLKYVLIGSDADVEDDIKEKSNGLMLLLDPHEIRKHLEKDVVVICTYQSANKLTEACDKKIKFDLAIFDEAHKTVGQRDKQFSRMLTNDELIINKRLFMTATPKIYHGRNNDIASMNDVNIYGECIYIYNTAQAIKAKKLTDYQILSVYSTDDAIAKDIKSNRLVKYEKEFEDTESQYLGTMLIILKKIKDGTINHLITYHNTVARANKFAKFIDEINRLMGNNDICVSGIDGKDSMRTRKNIIKEFSESKIGILCSARVLNEGVNIPIVDSVCFVDSRNSTIDIIQCIGRCLRLCEGKKMAYVVIPIFIKSLDSDFDKNEFGIIIKILKALKNTDDEISEYFISRECGPSKNVKSRNMIVNEGYDVISMSKEINFNEWCDSVCSKLWHIVDTWDSKFIAVKKWIKTNRKFPCRSNDDAEMSFFVWCNNQRKKYKNGTLCVRKKEKCETIDGWEWEVRYDDNVVLDFIQFREFKINIIFASSGESWFSAKDTANALGYKEKGQAEAVRTHVPLADKKQFKDIDTNYKNIHGHTIYINMTGLYTFLINSGMNNAAPFVLWFTFDILPKIKKWQGHVELQT